MDENFELGFSLVEGWFNGQMDWFQLIATLAGGMIILAGIVVIGISAFYRIAGEQVNLQVIGLHKEQRSIDPDDDEEAAAEKRANPRIRLEFRVKDGPLVGIEAMASSASTSVEHQAGDLVPGYIFPSSKDVMSRAQTISGLKFGTIFAGLGVGFILLVNFMAAQW